MRPERGPLQTSRSWLTWAMAFGIGRTVIKSAYRNGDLVGRLELDPVLREDPFPGYEQLRAKGPISSHKFVLATVDHAACTQILRGDDFGVAGGHGELPRPLRRILNKVYDDEARGPVDPPSMLSVDPPAHTRYRKLVTRAFTARAVKSLEDRARETADELLDDIASSGRDRVDIVDTYAAQLPVAVVAEILGVPREMHQQLLEWGNGAAVTLDPALTWRQYREAERNVRALHAWFDEHVAELRRSPKDDLFSKLVHLEGDDKLTDVELHSTGLLVLAAGFETTVNLIGNAVHQLGRHPDQLDLLREDPSLWGNAVEEVLRYDSPVQLTVRIPHRDTEVAGVPVKRDQAVLTLLGGANRDPGVFTDPDRFDVRRENANAHLAFSSGIHFCLGASLARMEAVVGLQALYARFPDLTPAGPPVRRGTRVLRGYEHLPVAVGAQQRASA
jgi:cytochrome P450